MTSRISNHSEQLDRKTCRSICDAVGERLQQSLRPGQPPDHLQYLLNELRRRDSANGRHSSN